MAKGVHTEGIVLAKFSCAEPNFNADGVVLFAVPDKGFTYLTSDCSWANAPVYWIINSIKKAGFFNMLIISPGIGSWLEVVESFVNCLRCQHSASN